MNATYVNEHQFSITGSDEEDTFYPDSKAGRRVECILSGGSVFRTVTSAVYGGGNTAVYLEDTGDNSDDLDATLTEVEVSVLTAGPSGGLPQHDHIAQEGEGGNILKKFFLA